MIFNASNNCSFSTKLKKNQKNKKNTYFPTTQSSISIPSMWLKCVMLCFNSVCSPGTAYIFNNLIG